MTVDTVQSPHRSLSGPLLRIRTWARVRPVLAYFLLTYASSWAWFVPLAVRGETVRAGVGWPTHLPGLAGPALAAVTLTALLDGRSGLRNLGRRLTRWRIGWSWWLLVAGTLSLASLGALVPMLTGGTVPTMAAFTRYTGIGAITPLGVVAVAFVANGIGEETGWRGFAADHLLHLHSLTWTALAVGAGWAGWHLPFFVFVDSFRSMGVLAAGWFVGLLAGSVVLTFLYRQGHHSILLAAAWHTAYNLSSGTQATGAVVGTATSVLVICGAWWMLRRDRSPGR